MWMKRKDNVDENKQNENEDVSENYGPKQRVK